MAETSRDAMGGQYGDDRNLAARQSIYSYARPGGANLFEWALDLAELGGDERLVDVCCGNGIYLAFLKGRAHRGPVHGLDLSAGMLAAARGWQADDGLLVGDAEALPWRDGSADVALCMHALYHVPAQVAAVAELRRVVRPGGRTLLVTNSVEHVREMDDLVAEVAGTRPLRAMLAFTVESGEPVLRSGFGSVVTHHLRGALDVTDAEAVVGYVSSTRGLYGAAADDRFEELAREVRRRVATIIERDGVFEVTTSTGCFVCR